MAIPFHITKEVINNVILTLCELINGPSENRSQQVPLIVIKSRILFLKKRIGDEFPNVIFQCFVQHKCNFIHLHCI